MEEIEGREEEVRVDYKMVFKSLKEINLECLPNLSGFCTGGDDFPFEWPSLEILRVRDCPKMMTFAATTSGSTPKPNQVRLDESETTLQGMDLNQFVQNCFKATVTYELESLMFPSNKKMIRSLSLEVSVDVQWPPEMSKGNDLVAVTVSHPPGQGYEEKAISTANSTPTKYAEPPKEETFVDVKVSSSVGLRHCEMCEKEVHGEQSVCCNWCRAVVYCSALCQKQHWKETPEGMCRLYKAMMEREEELAMKFFVFPCSAFQPCKWLESLDIHQKDVGWMMMSTLVIHLFIII
ncbi:unnamed protein product [Camellia sinensis]